MVEGCRDLFIKSVTLLISLMVTDLSRQFTTYSSHSILVNAHC